MGGGAGLLYRERFIVSKQILRDSVLEFFLFFFREQNYLAVELYIGDARRLCDAELSDVTLAAEIFAHDRNDGEVGVCFYNVEEGFRLFAV